MKKQLSAILAAAMLLPLLAACGGNSGANTNTGATSPESTPVTSTPTTPTTVETTPDAAAGTLEDLLSQVIAIEPVEFMGGTLPVDLTDTSEDGLWALKRYTGLDNADAITEAAVFEPMMGSLAYSMVMVRVAQDQDAKTVAEAMKAGIDTRKWVCVEANDLKVAACGDVVMLIMVDTETGMTAQSFVDAFQQAAGGELAFVI